jgi:acetyl esterase
MMVQNGQSSNRRQPQIRSAMLKKAVLLALGSVVLLSIAVVAALKFSPWPTALYLRRGWDKGGVEIARALEKHVPAGVISQLNEQYDPDDPDAYLDVFYPSAAAAANSALPTVVWVHGGSWLSGSKDHIANYLRILAARGFTTVGVGYSLAPRKRYPTPVRQVNTALAFIQLNAMRLHADPSKIFLAGDSAGTQIAAQVANIISAPTYAEVMEISPGIERSRLRGVIFHCGVYDAELARFGRSGVLWSYFGTKDFMKDPRIKQFSVARQITANFPPMFLSAGNADALSPQSHLLAEIAATRGVLVDSLFFSDGYAPPVLHQFQFDLDSEAGRIALERSVKFIMARLQ